MKNKNMTSNAALTPSLFNLQTTDTVPKEHVVKLKILETSDIHMHIADYDYYQTKIDERVGLARIATLIRQIRSNAKNTLLFDNGDAIQGTPLGDYMYQANLSSHDHPVYRVMNMLKYDAATVGNHEFNYGLPFLKQAVKGASFPIVNANVYQDGGEKNKGLNCFTPYIIFNKEVIDESGETHGIKVGVIGFVPPQIMIWDKGNLEGKVFVQDIIQSAKNFIPKMKQEGADIIIVLSHSGMGDVSGYVENAENVSAFLTTIPDIDAVLAGHSHDYRAEVIEGIPITMPGCFGSALGVIDLELHNEKGRWLVNKEQSKASLLHIYDKEAQVSIAAADPQVLASIQEEHEGTIHYVNQEVGISTAPIHSYFSLVQDDSSIQIVTNAQKEYVEEWLKLPENRKYAHIPVLSAGSPFKAGGRSGAHYYTDIEAGTLMIRNIADLYVYPNMLTAVLLTGADVKEWLEMSAGQFRKIDPESIEEQELINIEFPTYNFDILDGVHYQIDVTQPAKYDKDGNIVNEAAQRIVNITYAGKPVAAKQPFIVATNHYRGSSPTFPGAKNSTVILQAPDENRQIVVNYIQKKKIVDPTADGNWSFKPIHGKTLQVVFDCSPNAQKYLEGQDRIQYVGDSANPGFAKYRINMACEAAKATAFS